MLHKSLIFLLLLYTSHPAVLAGMRGSGAKNVVFAPSRYAARRRPGGQIISQSGGKGLTPAGGGPGGDAQSTLLYTSHPAVLEGMRGSGARNVVFATAWLLVIASDARQTKRDLSNTGRPARQRPGLGLSRYCRS